MEYTHSEGPWVETAVKLVIRKSDLDADLVSRSIPLDPTTVQLPGIDPLNPGSIRDGLWIVQVHGRMPGGVSEQLGTLLSKVEPHAHVLSQLASQGYEIHIDISGFVGRGATFTLPADVVRRSAALGLPVTISTSVSDR
ncbi:DUF4279 domain-containing protein [Streptomyces sp. NPDC006640]|uniref:DUF4279 domain-containing protein n=1 Tax=unclassified Streptomyces TaxID=2593676 RepID=UPI003684ADAF